MEPSVNCRITFFLSGLLLAAAGTVVIASQLAAEDIKKTSDIAVVVNPLNPLTDIKMSMLRKIVTGEQTVWSNRLTVQLVLREPGTPEQDVMLRVVAQMTVPQYKQIWTAKMAGHGASAEPLTVPSSGLAGEFVATHAGGIAFIRGMDVRRDLRVLKVDGILPGEEGYPLR